MRDWDCDWVCVQRDALQEIVKKQQQEIEQLKNELRQNKETKDDSFVQKQAMSYRWMHKTAT